MCAIILYCMIGAISFIWIMQNIKIMNKDDEIVDIIDSKFGRIWAVTMSLIWIVSFPLIIIPIWRKGARE